MRTAFSYFSIRFSGYKQEEMLQISKDRTLLVFASLLAVSCYESECLTGSEWGCPHEQALYFNYEVSRTTVPRTYSLDLACGYRPRNPFKLETLLCVDVAAQIPGVVEADLVVEPIPYGNNSVDVITAYDFLEHIPRLIYNNGQRRNAFVELMNEVWRVLRPGGIFFAVTPCYPYADAFVDPTHVNYVTADTFANYFTVQRRWAEVYGFYGYFLIAPPRFVSVTDDHPSKHLHTLMVKVDPALQQQSNSGGSSE